MSRAPTRPMPLIHFVIFVSPLPRLNLLQASWGIEKVSENLFNYTINAPEIISHS
jgi:hypothetical protein